MGRWGDGLFEGDYDLDAISDISASVDLKPLKKDVIRLRLKAWEQEQRNKKSGDGKDATDAGSDQTNKKPTKKELEEDWEFDVDLHTPRFPRLIRDLLNSGALASLIKEYGPKKANARWSEYQGHKDLVLIAYCAMELGCNLPSGFLARLKSNYRRVGLLGDEVEQIRRACEEYVDGKPYEFVSLGLIETMHMRMDGDNQRPEPRPPGLEPIPSAEAATTTAEEPASKRRKVGNKVGSSASPVEEYCLRFPPNTCANCGATRGHGAPDLKRCKGCKTTLYCFEGCQKWHWFRHRRHCRVDEEPEESAKHDSTDNGGDASEEKVQEATA